MQKWLKQYFVVKDANFKAKIQAMHLMSLFSLDQCVRKVLGFMAVRMVLACTSETK